MTKNHNLQSKVLTLPKSDFTSYRSQNGLDDHKKPCCEPNPPLMLLKLPPSLEPSDISSSDSRFYLSDDQELDGNPDLNSSLPSNASTNASRCRLIIESKGLTFDLVRVESSNAYVMFPPPNKKLKTSHAQTTPQSHTTCTSTEESGKKSVVQGRLLRENDTFFLECIRATADLEQLISGYLLKRYIYPSSEGVSVEQLSQILMYSRKEIIDALESIHAFIIPSTKLENSDIHDNDARIHEIIDVGLRMKTMYGALSEELERDTWDIILNVLSEWDGAIDYANKGVILDDMIEIVLKKSEISLERGVVQYCLEKCIVLEEGKKRYGCGRTWNNRSLSVKLDANFIAQLVAHNIFNSRTAPWKQSHFLSEWYRLMPGVGIHYEPQIDLLRGVAIGVTDVSPIIQAENGDNLQKILRVHDKNENDHKNVLYWKYFPKEQIMRSSVEQRFKMLFKEKAKWELEDLEPYFDKSRLKEVLMKYTRHANDDKGCTWYMSKYHPILGPHAASMMNDAAAAGHAHGYHAAAGNPNMIPRMRAFDDDDDLDDYENSGMGLRRDVNLNSLSGGNFRDVINAATANDDLHSSLRSSSAATAGGSSNNGFFGNDSSGDIHMENTSSNGRSQRLSDLFSPPVHLIHSAGGFQGARNVAKDSRRWLLVNVQSDSEFACHALNRDVWRNDLVESLVREGFVFWQSVNTSPEGQTYCQRYKVNALPHIGIIDPRTGMKVLSKEGWTMENPMTADQFAEMAIDFCSRNSFDKPPAAPSSTRGSGTSKNNSSSMSSSNANAASSSSISHGQTFNSVPAVEKMTEEQQLQAALRASMNESIGTNTNEAIDVDDDGDDDDNSCDDNGEYEYIESSDDDADADDGNNNDTPMRVNESLKEDTTTSKVEEVVAVAVKELTFHDEIVSMDVGEEPSTGARIMIRMPDGKRLVRKFNLEESVKMVYAFVSQSHDDAKNGKEFVMKAGFPPKDLISKVDDTIQSSGLAGDSVTVRWKED